MAVEFKDYYKILGVDRSADDKAIKSAYRKLARKFHPDVAKGKDGGDRFREINEAYEVLSDPEKRRRYDTLGPDWQRYAQPGPAGQPGGTHVEYGDLDDVQASVTISLEEAYSGARKSFEFEMDEPCPTCHGSGNVGGKPCATCHGSGWQRARRTVDVKIPAGVRSGQKVRVSGEGAGGAGQRGDLYLVVTVAPHPQFERKGDDIALMLPLTAPEAALGTTMEVPTLRGKVSMKVPPATSSGRTFRLPGYGMPRLRGAGAGDELVTVRIVMPSDLKPE